MCSWRSTFAVLTLWLAPAVSLAGPITFNLSPTGLYVPPGAPALEMALQRLLPPAPVYTFDPASGVPSRIDVVEYDPWKLPQPAPIDVHADGTTHWNNEGFFRVDMRLTDMASGDHANFSMWGRAHMYNTYGNGQWSGDVFYWFGTPQEATTFTLGGNDYTAWGQNEYTSERPTVSVWVGPNAPVSAAPEPGTLVLAALGLAPIGFRAARRRSQ